MVSEPIDREWLRTVGQSIDELVTTEVRFPGRLSGTNMIKQLYDAARAEAGASLSLAAGRALEDAIDPGETVLLATGAGQGHVSLPNGETDGPLGAVGLARALALGLGARPVITTEDHCLEPTIATLRAGGLNDLSYEELQQRSNAATVVPYPKEEGAGERAAEDFLETYDPAAIVAVEKGGPNGEGIYHSSSGSSYQEGRAKIAPLFDRAADEGVLTVGIGDAGNEIGFGRIEDAVRDVQPYGAECQCPCGNGMATRVATDHLIVANVSNWGAYGLQTMLAFLSETPEAMHGPDDERRMLEESTRSGANDGFADRPTQQVDGTTGPTNEGIVAVLQDLLRVSFEDPYAEENASARTS